MDKEEAINEQGKESFLKQPISRRKMLGVGVSAGVGLMLGLGGLGLTGSKVVMAAEANDRVSNTTNSVDGTVIPFYGRHQAGIATPQQNHLHFAAFDMMTKSRAELRELLRKWSEAAARMSAGQSVGDNNESFLVPPDDTGEALDLSAARLTITFGFGSTLFEKNGSDRFGLAARRPAELVDIPRMKHDRLEADRSGGDLCIQVCADDAQVAFHAVRNFARIARGVAVIRWSQQGATPTASTSTGTTRNLMGFKDGTNNINTEDEALMNQHVWVQSSGWMQNGSYLVARRVRILTEVWDRSSLDDQEKTIGRHKVSGAPIGSKKEFDKVDLDARGTDGEMLIPKDSHVRLAIGDGSVQILRRGYSFIDGIDPKTGQLDVGLFFVGFQRDPHKQFVVIQQRLAADDALNEYISHTGSALFACPPGAVNANSFIGEGLFT